MNAPRPTSSPPASAASASSPSPSEVTRLIEEARAGRTAAAEQLLPLVYDELRALAGALFRGQRRDHTLQPTALVHEAYARMVRPPASAIREADRADVAATAAAAGEPWTGRAHFFAVAAKAMRQVLANHARDRRRDKRGGGWHRVTLSDRLAPGDEHDLDLLALDEALETLSKLDDRQSRIVELRFFAEMSMPEIAQVMDISVSTAEREWRMARAWLSARLRDAEPGQRSSSTGGAEHGDA